MNQDLFSFELPKWELALQRIVPGGSLPAAKFLELLEGEDESEAEEALTYLEEHDIALDITKLPKDYGTGQTEERLRREEMLVKSGKLLNELAENDPLGIYLRELSSVPAAGDPRVLIDAYKQGDQDSLQRLIAVTIGDAVHTAMEYTGRGVLLLDLIQEASMGLWQGALNYDDGDLQAHLTWWVRQYLAKAVTLQARQAGVGSKMRKALEDYRAADHRLLTELGRNPSLEELAVELNVTPEEAEVYEDMLRTARIMEQAKKEPEEESQEDQQAVEDTAYFQSRQRILDMLSTLKPEQAQVLTLRYGLEGGLPMTAQEAAKKMNMTVQQITAMEAEALAKLRTEY